MNWADQVYREASATDWRGLYGIGVRLLDARGDLVQTVDVKKSVWLALSTEDRRREHAAALVAEVSS